MRGRWEMLARLLVRGKERAVVPKETTIVAMMSREVSGAECQGDGMSGRMISMKDSERESYSDEQLR